MNSGGQQPAPTCPHSASEAGTPDLSPAAWDARYAAADIPWDMGQVSPPLVCFREERVLPPGRRVLVPGCGSGYDVAFLAAADYEAVGVDFSPRAIETARRLVTSRNGSTAIVADLLAPDIEALGVFDWAFDQTFFCAIDPTLRGAYCTSMRRLIRPGGEMWALSFRVPTPGGPPFDSTPEEYIDLMSVAGFVLVERRALDAVSHPARRGRETLVRMLRK
jgi:SAM-dependent methyltransferase